MTVPYEVALDTLQSMFGQTDRDVIAMLLQANQGHMERTVENLLAMQEAGGSQSRSVASRPPVVSSAAASALPAQPPAAAAAAAHLHPGAPHYPSQPPGPYPPQYPPFPAQPPYAVQPGYPGYPPPQPNYYVPPQNQYHQPNYEREQKRNPASSPHPVPVQYQARPPPKKQATTNNLIKLPDDFLRPPSYYKDKPHPHPAATAVLRSQTPAALSANRPPATGEEKTQIEQDLLLAQMLQDELFMQDLQEHPERYGMPQQQQQQRQQQQQQQQQQANRKRHADEEEKKGSAATPKPTPHIDAPPLSSQIFNPGTSKPNAVAAAAPATAAAAAAVVSSSSSTSAGHVPDVSSQHSDEEEKRSTTFREKWNSLTSAARQKLANISSKLNQKKQKEQTYQSLTGFNEESNRLYDEDDDDEFDPTLHDGMSQEQKGLVDDQVDDHRFNEDSESGLVLPSDNLRRAESSELDPSSHSATQPSPSTQAPRRPSFDNIAAALASDESNKSSNSETDHIFNPAGRNEAAALHDHFRQRGISAISSTSTSQEAPTAANEVDPFAHASTEAFEVPNEAEAVEIGSGYPNNVAGEPIFPRPDIDLIEQEQKDDNHNKKSTGKVKKGMILLEDL